MKKSELKAIIRECIEELGGRIIHAGKIPLSQHKKNIAQQRAADAETWERTSAHGAKLRRDGDNRARAARRKSTGGNK